MFAFLLRSKENISLEFSIHTDLFLSAKFGWAFSNVSKLIDSVFKRSRYF